MKKGSDVHKAFVEVVTHKVLLKDIRMLVHFCHTGALETFHNLILKNASKRQEFAYCQMEARIQLAALDNNHNAGREQAVVQRPVPGGASNSTAAW